MTSVPPRTPSGTWRSSSFAPAVSRWQASTHRSERAQLPVRARRGGVAANALPDDARRALPRRPRARPRARRAAVPARRAPRLAAAGARGDRRCRRAVERRPGGSCCALRGRGAGRPLMQPTGGSRACSGGGRSRSRRCSSSASSTTRSIVSTRGRRTRAGSGATGCSRT